LTRATGDVESGACVLRLASLVHRSAGVYHVRPTSSNEAVLPPAPTIKRHASAT
jgi:hypothetical protein